MFSTLAWLLFPKLCYACKKLLKDPSYEGDICPDCLAKLEPPTKQGEKIYSLYKFNPTAQLLIHQLKYRNKKKIGWQLCSFGAERIRTKINTWNIQGIVPVPLFPTRFKQRSYNQSEQIGKALSQILDIPLYNKICQRVRYTQSQTKLTKAERVKNLQGAFRSKIKNHLGNKNLLAVDDVLTTGSTLKNLSLALHEVTDGKIYGFTLANANEK